MLVSGAIPSLSMLSRTKSRAATPIRCPPPAAARLSPNLYAPLTEGPSSSAQAVICVLRVLGTAEPERREARKLLRTRKACVDRYSASGKAILTLGAVGPEIGCTEE